MSMTERLAWPTLVLLLASAGCGAADGDADQTATTSTTATTAATSATAATATATATPTREGRRTRRSVVIRWLKEFAPEGGGGTNQESAYVALMQGQCEDSLSLARAGYDDAGGEPLEEPYRSLFEGAAAACLAAFHGRAELWPTATRSLEAIGDPRFDCWDLAVYRMLQTLVQAHRDNPDATFVRGGSGWTCPEISDLVPDHGPRGGGYRIEVVGRNLAGQDTVHWDERQVPLDRDADGRLTVLVPPAGPDAGGSSYVNFGGYRSTGSAARFTYDD